MRFDDSLEVFQTLSDHVSSAIGDKRELFDISVKNKYTITTSSSSWIRQINGGHLFCFNASKVGKWIYWDTALTINLTTIIKQHSVSTASCIYVLEGGMSSLKAVYIHPLSILPGDAYPHLRTYQRGLPARSRLQHLGEWDFTKGLLWSLNQPPYLSILTPS
jgi:hypothetical protein